MRIAILFLLFATAAQAATSGGRGGQAATGAQAPMRASNGFTRGGGYPVNRPMPGPLDPKRKVNEQDCSKPIDLTAGNLKCK
jgi:hypothetical protein